MSIVTNKLGTPDFNRLSQKDDVKGDLVSNYAKTKQNYPLGKGRLMQSSLYTPIKIIWV